MSDISKKYQVATNYIHRKIVGKDVLISVAAGVADFNGYIELNPSASVLWDRLKHECTAEELAQTLQDVFQIDAEEARNDTAEFLQLLAEHHMLQEI